MSFYVRHRYGGNNRDVTSAALDALLDELERNLDDVEHSSVSVVHESDWAVAVYTSGLVTLENVEDLELPPRHMLMDSPRDARRLLGAAAAGDLDQLFAADWRDGYGDGR